MSFGENKGAVLRYIAHFRDGDRVLGYY